MTKSNFPRDQANWFIANPLKIKAAAGFVGKIGKLVL